MRNTLLLSAALVAAAPVFAQQTAQQKIPTRAEAIAATNEADAKRIEALLKGDTATLEAMFTKDMVYTHSNGKVDTKEALLETLKTGATKYLSVVLSEKKHQNYGNTVIVTGLGEMKLKSGETELAFKVRFTQVWTRQKGEWKFAAWQSTRLPEAK